MKRIRLCIAHPRPFFLQAGLGLLAVLFLPLLFTTGCSSGKDKKKGGKYAYKLKCSGGQAIVTKLIRETEKPKERGPVLLPSKLTCDKAEDLDEKKIKKLKRDGKWEFYFSKSDGVLATGLYKRGLRVGTWTYFYEDGKKRRTVEFKRGKKEGPEISWFKDGSVESEGQNRLNRKEGLWKFYNAPGANCITQGTYKKDKKSGAWEECKYDADSKKWYIGFKGSYRGGLRDGKATFYNKDGQVTREGSFKADLSKACKENPPKLGSPPVAKYENCGKKDGLWKTYHPNGKLASEGHYKNGKRDGHWVEYYKTGEKLAEGPRSATHKGFRKGLWTFYNKDGSIFGKFGFDKKEVFTKSAILYKNGKKMAEGGLSMGIIQYDPKQDKIKKPTLKYGGHWKFYDEKGRLVREGDMNLGNMHGYWKFYENGRLVREGGMNSNKQHGKWKYYKNGRLVAEGTMNLGKKHGKWRERKGGRWVTSCYMIGRPTTCR